MANRLTIKGQVTIPKEVRAFLGLRSGDSAVEFTIAEDGTVRVTKAAEAKEPAIGRIIRRSDGGRTPRGAGIDILSLLSGCCA